MGLSLLHANDRTGEHAPSWYAASANPIAEFPALEGDHTFDVAIIGGGYSGLSAALHLAEAGYKTCVLEAHRVGWGASGRNGGQVASGQRIGQQELETLVGLEKAKAAFDIGIEAAGTVRGLIKKHRIQCAYRDGVIEAFHKPRFNRHGQEDVEHLHKVYDYRSISYLEPEEMREKVGSEDFSAGVLDTASGHLHPLNFARGLAKAAVKAGAQIFELSEVREIKESKPNHVLTAKGSVTAKWVVLACNGYLGNLDRKIAGHVMPINNFIIATEPLDNTVAGGLIRDGEAVADSRFVISYFRFSEDNRLLFGGGETYGYRFPDDIRSLVRPHMLKIYPDLADTRIDYAWGGTLAITRSRLPHFEFRADGLVNISGYSGSGVAMATMAGKLAAEAINGQMARFDVMRSLPTPKFPGGAALRWPLLPLAMLWYAMLDKL